MPLILVWGLAGILLAWSLREVPLMAVAQTFQRFTAIQIAGLIALNLVILLMFSLRWWLILRAQGWRVGVLRVLAYRLAAFGVTYFTPGPQFGGEPLQVALLMRRDGMPAAQALASVSLDKLIELLVNFGFIVFGLLVITASEIGTSLNSPLLLPLFLLLQALPLIYLLVVWRGSRPLGWLTGKLPLARWARLQRIAGGLIEAEASIHLALRAGWQAILVASGLNVLAWALSVLEMNYSLWMLGNPLDFVRVIGLLTALRMAFLAPTPAGLGALEAALVLSMQALGLPPASGLALALLIRGRDVSLGLVGLLLGVWLLGSARALQPTRKPTD